jgi:hypothetical protein
MPTRAPATTIGPIAPIAIPMVRQAPSSMPLLYPATDPEPKRLHARLTDALPVGSPHGRCTSAGTDDAHGDNMSRVMGKPLSLR